MHGTVSTLKDEVVEQDPDLAQDFVKLEQGLEQLDQANRKKRSSNQVLCPDSRAFLKALTMPNLHLAKLLKRSRVVCQWPKILQINTIASLSGAGCLSYRSCFSKRISSLG